MKTCPKCGGKINDLTVYCPCCSARQEETTARDIAYGTSEKRRPFRYPVDAKVPAGAVIALVVMFLVSVQLLLNRSGSMVVLLVDAVSNILILGLVTAFLVKRYRMGAIGAAGIINAISVTLVGMLEMLSLLGSSVNGYVASITLMLWVVLGMYAFALLTALNRTLNGMSSNTKRLANTAFVAAATSVLLLVVQAVAIQLAFSSGFFNSLVATQGSFIIVRSAAFYFFIGLIAGKLDNAPDRKYVERPAEPVSAAPKTSSSVSTVSTISPSFAPGRSCFDGTTMQMIGVNIVCWLMTAFSLGIAYPWAVCRKQRWIAKHTLIQGKRLMFVGRGGELMGKYIVWFLLCIITIGIYFLWLPVKIQCWVAENTLFDE